MLLPVIVELLEFFVANLDILSQLLLLDVVSELVLVLDDVLLELPDLAHQILEHLVLQDVAELLRQQLHLGLNQREYQDLLVLVQEAVAIAIEHVHKVRRRLDPQQVIDDLLVAFEDQVDVGLIEDAFLSKVSFPDGKPDVLGLACAAQLKNVRRP